MNVYCFLLGNLCRYKVDDVFRVLSDIDRYKEFLPWCQESIVIRELTDSKWIAKLSVGYPPVLETFTSLVILRPPTRIRVSPFSVLSLICLVSVFSMTEHFRGWEHVLTPGQHLGTAARPCSLNWALLCGPHLGKGYFYLSVCNAGYFPNYSVNHVKTPSFTHQTMGITNPISTRKLSKISYLCKFTLSVLIV